MSEEQVKEVIERIGYQEFYRYYEDKDVLIRLQKEEIERLNKRIDKTIEYCENNKEFTPRLKDIIEILKGSDKE